MKLYLKIIFLLTVLIFMTYILIVAFETETTDTNDKGVMESIKENFTENKPYSVKETGYTGIPVMSRSVNKMQYNSL